MSTSIYYRQWSESHVCHCFIIFIMQAWIWYSQVILKVLLNPGNLTERLASSLQRFVYHCSNFLGNYYFICMCVCIVSCNASNEFSIFPLQPSNSCFNALLRLIVQPKANLILQRDQVMHTYVCCIHAGFFFVWFVSCVHGMMYFLASGTVNIVLCVCVWRRVVCACVVISMVCFCWQVLPQRFHLCRAGFHTTDCSTQYLSVNCNLVYRIRFSVFSIFLANAQLFWICGA